MDSEVVADLMQNKKSSENKNNVGFYDWLQNKNFRFKFFSFILKFNVNFIEMIQLKWLDKKIFKIKLKFDKNKNTNKNDESIATKISNWTL